MRLSLRELRPAAARTIVLVLCAAPIAAQACLVPRFGVNVVISDEWSQIPFIRLVLDGGNWPASLFEAFNDNRPAVLRVLLAVSVPYTRWDAMPIMYLSVLVTSATLFGLWRLYRDTTDLPAWYFVPVAWLAVSLAQYQNLFWAFQITFLLTMCSAVWCLVAATRAGYGWLATSLLLAGICTFSSAGGALIWPVVLIVLVARRARFAAVATWLAVMAGTGALYLHGLRKTPMPDVMREAWRLIRFCLAMLGAPLLPRRLDDASMAGAACVLGGAVVAGLLIKHRRRLTPAQWGPIGLGVFGLAYAGVTTLARLQFGDDFALTSRYISITVASWIGVYVLAIGLAHRASARRWPVGILGAAMLIAAAAADVQSWQSARVWGQTYGRINKFVLQTRPTIGPAEQRAMTITPEHVAAANLEHDYLARHGLSYFHDPIEWWLLVDTSDATGLYVSEHAPVVQRFICPVDTLYDAAVLVDPGRDAAAARLRLDLVDPAAGLVLASREIARSGMPRGRFVVRLPHALQACRGRALTLVMTALDGSGNDAFATYAFHPFLDGELRAGAPLGGRSLGLELNTRHFDIRDVH